MLFFICTMATPVVTDKWAGNFDCSVCRRKRLTGDQFSNKALERYRKQGGPLKCIQCVEAAQAAEREAAASKKGAALEGEQRICVACQKTLDYSAYNRNQWSKGEGKSRCRTCVEESLQAESSKSKDAKEQKIKEAKEAVKNAKTSRDTKAILEAESVLSSLEAEKVTGLKPVKMGRGRGRGRGRLSSRGGRSSRG